MRRYPYKADILELEFFVYGAKQFFLFPYFWGDGSGLEAVIIYPPLIDRLSPAGRNCDGFVFQFSVVVHLVSLG